MKIFKTHKKLAVSSLALVVALVTGGAAYAFLTGGGSGQGSATVGSVSQLSITQVGSAYDSLITSNAYVQDQCFSCVSITEFGNSIHLATTGQLSDVVVAVRNWGDAFNGAATLNIYNPSDLTTPIATDTQNFNIAVATVDVGNSWSSTSVPSVTNLTFDFSSQDVTLPSNVVYGITYGSASDWGNVNIALSSSATNLTVGTDPSPGYVWVTGTNPNPIAFAGDANSCSGTTTSGAFSPEYMWCGFNANNPGAYGNVGGASADIPAVEFNVVGGGIPTLYPSDPPQPIEYAITNPGAAQQVDSVTATIRTDSGNGLVETWNGSAWVDVPGCYAEWFQINNSPQALNYTVPENSTTIFGSAMQTTVAGDVLSIQMLNGAPGAGPQNQDACEGATLGLVFSSN